MPFFTHVQAAAIALGIDPAAMLYGARPVSCLSILLLVAMQPVTKGRQLWLEYAHLHIRRACLLRKIHASATQPHHVADGLLAAMCRNDCCKGSGRLVRIPEHRRYSD